MLREQTRQNGRMARVWLAYGSRLAGVWPAPLIFCFQTQKPGLGLTKGERP